MEIDFKQRELNEYHKIKSVEEGFKALSKLNKQFFKRLKIIDKSLQRLNEEKVYRNLEYEKRINKERFESLNEKKEYIKLCVAGLSSVEKHYYDLLYYEIQTQLSNQNKKNFNNIKVLVELLSKELVIKLDLNGSTSSNIQQYQYQQLYHQQQVLYGEYQDNLWIENQIEIELDRERNSIVIDRPSTINRLIEILIQKFM